MSTRKCTVCNGTGSLWGTAKMFEEGGLKSPKDQSGANIEGATWGVVGGIGPNSDQPDNYYGLQVTCWRCLGKSYVPDDKRDEGETNG